MCVSQNSRTFTDAFTAYWPLPTSTANHSSILEGLTHMTASHVHCRQKGKIHYISILSHIVDVEKQIVALE